MTLVVRRTVVGENESLEELGVEAVELDAVRELQEKDGDAEGR